MIVRLTASMSLAFVGVVVGGYLAAQGAWLGAAGAVISGLCLAGECLWGDQLVVRGELAFIGCAVCTALGITSVMFERGHFDIDSNASLSEVGDAALTIDIHGHHCPDLGHAVRDRVAVSCSVAPNQNTAAGIRSLLEAQYMGAAYGLAQSVREINAPPESECIVALKDLVAVCPTFVRQLSPKALSTLAL